MVESFAMATAGPSAAPAGRRAPAVDFAAQDLLAPATPARRPGRAARSWPAAFPARLPGAPPPPGVALALACALASSTSACARFSVSATSLRAARAVARAGRSCAAVDQAWFRRRPPQPVAISCGARRANGSARPDELLVISAPTRKDHQLQEQRELMFMTLTRIRAARTRGGSAATSEVFAGGGAPAHPQTGWRREHHRMPTPIRNAASIRPGAESSWSGRVFYQLGLAGPPTRCTCRP